MTTMTRWLTALALLLGALPSHAQPTIAQDFTSNVTVSVDGSVLLPALDQQHSLFPVFPGQLGILRQALAEGVAIDGETFRVYESNSGHVTRYDRMAGGTVIESVYQFWNGSQPMACTDPGDPATCTALKAPLGNFGSQYRHSPADGSCTKSVLLTPNRDRSLFDPVQRTQQFGTCSVQIGSGSRSGSRWVIRPIDGENSGAIVAVIGGVPFFAKYDLCANGNTPLETSLPALGVRISFVPFTPGTPAASNFMLPEACATAEPQASTFPWALNAWTFENGVQVDTVDLFVDTAGPASVNLGDALDYSLTVRNLGIADSSGVDLLDNLPAGLSFGSVTSSQGTCSYTAPTLYCTLGALASGASATVTINTTATTIGRKANTASVIGADTRLQGDPVLGNNQDTAITEVDAAAGPAYVATVQPPIKDNGKSVFKATRGVVPVKFTLLADGAFTYALPPATIRVSRTGGGTPEPIDESIYSGSADIGSSFRVSDCQYIYNLNVKAFGVGSYRVDILIAGTVVGSAFFALK